MIIRPGIHPRNHRQTAGFTFPEVLIAAVIGFGVASALLILVTSASWEQRRGLVNAILLREAGSLQDEITRLIRSMSISEGVLLGQENPDQSQYHRRLIGARGVFPDHPREELRFDPETLSVHWNPDFTGGSATETTLFESTPTVRLRSLDFYLSQKAGFVPDASIVNVRLELDDDGASGQYNPDGTAKVTSVVRTFSVRLRNE